MPILSLKTAKNKPNFIIINIWRLTGMDSRRGTKIIKIRFGRGNKAAGLAVAVKLQGNGVQGMVSQDEAGALFIGQPVFHERQI